MLKLARDSQGLGEEALVLREDDHSEFDEQGRRTRTLRRVLAFYAGHDESALRESWLPSLEDKPRIRARLISAGGAVRDLSPELVTDAPMIDDEDGVSERRVAALRLPAIKPGDVLEYQQIVHQFRLLAGSGISDTVTLGSPSRTLSTRISVSAPRALPLKVIPVGLPRGARPSLREGARRVWSLDLGTLPPELSEEESAPADFVARPTVSFTWNASWKAAASAYRADLERAMTRKMVPLPEEGRHGDERARLRAIRDWVLGKVRWNQIFISNAGWTPSNPATTLERGVGDAKDLGVLLVSLLRQAKIPADLALVTIGSASLPHPELPGLNVFNHAVVRARVQGRDVWIDPTARWAALGALPPVSQGRRALVLDERLERLVLTPGAAPSDNVVRQVRTYELQQAGGADLVEEETLDGAFAMDARSYYNTTAREDVDRNIREYARGTYRTDLVGSYTTKDAEPRFTTRLVAKSAQAFFGARTTIAGTLDWKDVLDRIPEELTADPAATAARRSPFVWERPQVIELEQRYLVPEGYGFPELELVPLTRIGPASLQGRSRREGRALIVSFRFESGKTTYSAAEVNETRRKLAELRDAASIALTFPSLGLQHADAGEHGAAIAALAELVRRDPRNVVYQTQLAIAYRVAGMIPAARRAALRATELDPKHSDAHVVLALALDGRAAGFGYDRGGSLAALRKAIAANPNNVGALAELALHLSQDEHELPSTDAAELREAAELYRVAHELSPEDGYDLRALGALARAGAYDEVERKVTAMSPSQERDILLVVSTAVAKGPGAAISAARKLASGGSLTTLLDSAILDLQSLRLYAEAEAFRKAARPLGAAAARPEDSRRRVVELERLDPGDPKTALLTAERYVQSGVRPPRAPWSDAVTRVLLRRRIATSSVYDPNLPEELQHAPSPRNSLRATTDRLAAELTAEVRPLAQVGWLVRWHDDVVYVARTPQRAELLAIGDELDELDGLGRHVGALVRRGDLAAARVWLDAIRQEQGASDPEWAAFWPKGGAPTRERAELAAAALSAEAPGGDDLRALERCRGGPRASCDKLLLKSYAARGEYAKAEAVGRRVLAASPAEVHARLLLGRVLTARGKLAEADTVVTAALGIDPKDPGLLFLSSIIAARRSDHARAEAALVAAQGGNAKGAVTELAWSYLFHGRKLAEGLAGLADLREAGERSPAVLSTLAALQAELGDDRASATLAELVATISGELRRQDWFVIGRIAERLGLREDALDAYARSMPQKGEQPGLLDVSELASRRAAALKRTAQSKRRR